MKDMAYW